jgi:Glycine rich protein
MPLISGSTTGTNIQYTKTGTIRRNDTASLYSFSSIQFQACGAVGRLGPTLAQMQSTYSSQSWTSNTSYLSMVGSGTHKWTVPTTGYYRITAAGAPGGGGSDWFSGTSSYDSSGNQGKPGAGIIISANFWLTSGDTLYILVGQKGVDNQINNPGGFGPSDTDGGGGGGTFVAKKVADSTQSQYLYSPDSAYVQPLIVAGGGGGGSSDGDAASAVFIPNQLTSNFAQLDQWGYSTGGGWNKYPGDEVISGLTARINLGISGVGNGANSNNGQKPGFHFLQGGAGGSSSYPGYTGNTWYGNGGFGGGGGSTDEGGAGGGGWIGGINGDNSGAAAQSSQGGSSFVNPDAVQVTNDGYNTWASLTSPNGYCTVTYFGQ